MDNVLETDKKIYEAAKTIVFACMSNILIGLLTDTLGLWWNQDEAIIGIVFRCGFPMKNYCGGIWLVVFILYYVYYYRTKNLKQIKNKVKLSLFVLMIVMSSSKGALILLVAFWSLMNYENWFKIVKSQRRIVNIVLALLIIIVGVFFYKVVFASVYTFAYRMRGVTAVIEIITADLKSAFLGISNIAYSNTGLDYTTNMRDFFGWQASVEMAYVNIFVKYGMLGFAAYFIIFKRYFNSLSRLGKNDKTIVFAILGVLLLSGFVETYIVTIHYVVGPVMYCLINGMCNVKNINPSNEF